MSTQPQRFLGLPFFLALLGILFSLWNLFGDSSALCITEGCNLFQNFSIAGISMWWGGIVGCGLLLAAAVPGFAFLGLLLTGIGLVLDAFLLLVMLLTAPCFNCMIIGVILALIFLAYRAAWREGERQRGPYSASPLLWGWGLLLLLNIGALVNSETGPWALSGNALAHKASEAQVQVYFSPSCPACLELVQEAGSVGAESASSVGWYPVADESRDLWVIAALKRRVQNGEELVPALTAALAETPANPSALESLKPGMLWLQYRLWRNQAHVLKSGTHVLPYVEFRGKPAFMGRREESPAPRASAAPSNRPAQAQPAQLPFLDVDSFCGEGSEPCDPPAPNGEPSLIDLMQDGQNAS